MPKLTAEQMAERINKGISFYKNQKGLFERQSDIISSLERDAATPESGLDLHAVVLRFLPLMTEQFNAYHQGKHDASSHEPGSPYTSHHNNFPYRRLAVTSLKALVVILFGKELDDKTAFDVLGLIKLVFERFGAKVSNEIFELIISHRDPVRALKNIHSLSERFFSIMFINYIVSQHNPYEAGLKLKKLFPKDAVQTESHVNFFLALLSTCSQIEYNAMCLLIQYNALTQENWLSIQGCFSSKTAASAWSVLDTALSVLNRVNLFSFERAQRFLSAPDLYLSSRMHDSFWNVVPKHLISDSAINEAAKIASYMDRLPEASRSSMFKGKYSPDINLMEQYLRKLQKHYEKEAYREHLAAALTPESDAPKRKRALSR